MQLYDIQAYSESIREERVRAAEQARQAKAARASDDGALYDPFTLRWAWNRIANWSAERTPSHIRKGGYGDMFPGSFR